MAGESFRYPNNSLQEPHVSGNFGPRTPFWTPGGWTSSFHYGTDMVWWTRITSPVNGVVTLATYSGGFGNLVKVREDGTGDEFWHAHLASFGVRAGDRVSVGQFLGIMGTTGRSTGVHLHWEVHPRGGSAVDPRPYSRNRIAAAAGGGSRPTPTPTPTLQEEQMFNLIANKDGGGTKMFFVLPNPRAAADAKQKPFIGMVIDGPAPTGIPTYHATGQWSEPYARRYIENYNTN
uniref:Metallo-endopeptidase n=2 Tax=unclassified bacterial viruses TaxID=12333 RepID=A0AAU7J884_9VIRU